MRVFLAFLIGSGAMAQPRLEWRPLVAEALRANPEVQAAQKRYEAARQRPSQASSLPGTMLSVGYASTGSPRPFAGLGTDPVANAGVMVSQQIPFPGKRGLRGAIAEREAEAEFQQYQAIQLSVAARVKTVYHKLHHTYEMADILERSRNMLRASLRVTEARYALSKASQQDLLKAQTQITALALRLERTRQERRSLEAELNQLLYRQPGTPVGRPVEPVTEEFKLRLDELVAAARENSPMLRRERKVIERSELAVNLARKDFYPDYTVSAGYFNMGRMADMYQVRVDFELPTSWRSRQRAGVAEQAATLSATRRGYEAADQALLYRIQDDFRVAETSHRLMTMYHDTLLPQARATLESSLSAYETGQVDFLNVLSSVVAVLEYENGYHEEEMSYYLALVRIEEMTGAELP